MVQLTTLLFALITLVCPWPIGGNWPFARTIFLIVSCVLLLSSLFVKQTEEERPVKDRPPLIWWLLLIGVGYTVFQASPLSTSIQSIYGADNQPVSSAEQWKTDDAPLEFEPEIVRRPISINPAATREKLIDLLLGVGVFFGATVLLTSKQNIQCVFACLTITGVGLSFLGIIQKLSGDHRIFWNYELLWGGSKFSTFVNSNNAAGFLTICFGAVVFFVARYIFQSTERSPSASHSGFEDGSSYRLVRAFAKLQPHHLYFLTATIIIVAGNCAALSKGGMLAMAASVLTAMLLISRTNKLATAAFAAIVVAGGVGVIAFSGQTNQVAEEVRSLEEIEKTVNLRMLHWQDALSYGLDNAILGCGNGTYRYASPAFQTFFFSSNFAHAESVFVETFVELGVFGVVLLLACLAYMGYCSLMLLRRASALDRAIGVTTLTCLAGQFVANLFDFGIYQPANTIALATVCGVAVGRTGCSPSKNESRRPSKSSVSVGRVLRFALVLVTAGASCWATYESWAVESRRKARRSIKLFNEMAKKDFKLSRLDLLDRAKVQLNRAISIRPDDAEALLLSGDLRIARYRIQQARAFADELRGELERIESSSLSAAEIEQQRKAIQQFTPEVIWSTTTIELNHRRLRIADRFNLDEAKRIRDSSEVLELLSGAFEKYAEAELACPRMAKTQYRLASLCAFGESHSPEETIDEEAAYIRSALRRGVPSTQLLFKSGLLALNSGDRETAVTLWAKVLRYPRRNAHEKLIVELCLQEIGMKQFFEHVIPQNPEDLLKICRRYMRSPEMALPRKFLIVHIRRVIENSEKLSDLERFLLSADAATLVNDYPEAVNCYRNALGLAETPVPWRFDYAFALFQTKQFDESVRQLKICELDPNVRKNRVKALLARIRRQRFAH